MNNDFEKATAATATERLFASLQHITFEILFTFACLVFIVISVSVENTGLHPAVVLAANILSYIAGGWYGIQKAYESLREGKLNVDLLMIISAIGAATIDQWHEGAILLFLFSLSNVLQEYAMDRSRNAIKALLKLRPNTAMIIRNGTEIEVAVNDLQIEDHVVIRPGEAIPIDGAVIKGYSEVDQSSITGESVPVEKNTGDIVFAGTLNGSGSLEIKVTKRANDSTLSRIIQLVESAQHQRARTQRFLDTFESYYAVGVIVFTVGLILVPWLLLGTDFDATFYRAMVILVVASPCALIISTPASILSAIANGARRGILYKGGAYMEKMSEVKVVAFDKTGTLTEGKMHVTDMYVSKQNCPVGYTENDLIALAATLESRSEHPIAKAVVNAAAQKSLSLPEMSNFASLPGRGVHAKSQGFLTWIGGFRMFEEHGETIPDDILREKTKYESEGKTVLIVHRELGRSGDKGIHEEEGGWLGCIAVADIVREDTAQTIQNLKASGIVLTVMLTGDNATVAGSIAKQAGIDKYYADLLPEQKVQVLRSLEKEYGPVAMVGDGVNDAPALATASVGIAMGAAGTDVAMETADVVLMSDKLSNIPYAVNLSKRAKRVVWQNISFAMAVIAALVISALGLSLPLPLGVVGHEGSTLIVVANGLRLLRR